MFVSDLVSEILVITLTDLEIFWSQLFRSFAGRRGGGMTFHSHLSETLSLGYLYDVLVMVIVILASGAFETTCHSRSTDK